ncbi:outer membrane protein assembly factor BamA [Haliangium sp.]|uniref:outer membrane protein assembly factor BamA n=1 Tax=Haliangium sp. TaxID=2663208 RepID=UPI003D0C33E4
MRRYRHSLPVVTAVLTWMLLAAPAAADSSTDAATGALYGLPIERIQFRGNRKVEDDAIRVNLSSQVGGKLNPELVRRDLRAMWQMGFFDDVEVRAEPTVDGGVVLLFVVVEKPSVRKILVSGNDEVGLDKINEVLDLKRDAILDVSKVKQNRQKIYDLYVEKGYYLAAVDYDVRPVNETEVDVWYVIEERAKVEIREVSFVGNEKISDEELRGLISTSPGGALSFLGDGGIYQEEAFQRDLLMITAYYYDRGFINVKLGQPLIQLSRDKRYMYLSIPIDEGPVFEIGEIDFKGDLIGDKADYYKRLTVKPGEVFNRSKVGNDITQLTNYYKDRGYAYANVTPLTKVDLEKRTVALTFEIVQGKKVFFERINVRGNNKTRDKVIRREMKVSEGELFSQTGLDVSQRRIQALGFFETVNVSTTRGSSDEFIEVNVEVIERPTGTFQIGAGFSSVERFIAQAQISQNNLFGRGQTLTLQAQLSGLRQLFLLRFADPYFLDTRWTFAFDLFNQSRAFGGFTRNSTGGTLTWGYPLSWESRVFLTYKLEQVGVSTGTNIINVGPSEIPVETSAIANLFRDGLTSSLRASMSYDSRNNRLFPTGGWYMNGFVEVAEEIFGSQNVFVRYGGFVRHYRPIWGPFVLKLNGEVGVTTSRNRDGVPITERYIIGGIYDVRGFRPRSLGPRIFYPGGPDDELRAQILGGNMQLVLNAEIEFPLFERVGISGVVFADAGNAYNLEQRYCAGSAGDAGTVSAKFDPCFRFPESITQGIRRSVGFGFRWFSPIGPLRFEWGIPLDRQEVVPGDNRAEEDLVFEFTIGNFF